MRTIRQQLLLWLIGGMLTATTIAGAALYFTVREEANELFDSQLRRIVASLPAEISVQANPSSDDEIDDDIVVEVWGPGGALLYASRPSQPLPRFPGTGFTTRSVDDERWRVYGEIRRDRYIQVAQAMSGRDELVYGSAMRSLLPYLALMPVLAVLIGVVVGRSLRPLQRVALALGRRSADAMQPLSTDGIPPELQPMLDAVNDLLERLNHALDAQRAFVADAAHELRSPLAALKLQLQLAERARTDEQRGTAFAKLHARLDRATHLVQQLLTLARHQPQMAEPAFAAVDLKQLARQVIVDRDSLADSKGIDLGAEFAAAHAIVEGDEGSLRIMLGNLVDNALRYTPRGGQVDVIVLLLHGHPALRVADNGPGIAEDERARVFDRFYRGENSDISGSGLGLAIVNNIADQHGAVVSLNDNPLGTGLLVTVEFCARPSSGTAGESAKDRETS